MQLHIPSEKEIRETYREGEDAVVALIQKLSSGIATMTDILLKQQALIEKLQGQIAKTKVDPMSRPIFAFFKLHSDLVMQDDFV